MPVNDKHSEYEKREPQWIRCRDCIAGTDRVKDENSRKYLPALQGQSTQEYDNYKMRALFYGATGRTVQGLLGAVFRKPANIEYPEEEHEQEFTNTGLDLNQTVNKVTEEIISVGRTGILVDPSGDTGEHRAFAAIYSAESIINWRTEKIDGIEKLTLVVLKEEREEVDADGFGTKSKTQYRVLRLSKDKNNRIYTQEVWIKMKDREEYIIDPKQNVTPRKAGLALDEIPFYFINVNDLTPCTNKPPLLDLVDVNLSHYRTSADYEHGAHFTALPTAWVAGFDTESQLRIGSGIAWVSDNPAAKAGFLEYTGQGLGALRDLMNDKESLMAKLGARLLEEQKNSSEAFETHKLRQSGESGALLSMVISISLGMEKVLRKMAWWSGYSDAELEKISFELNKDFVSAKLSPQELTSLMQAWQGGGISQESFLWNLKQGEILPEDISVEDEKDRIDAETGTESLGDIPDITPQNRNFQLVRDASGNLVGAKETTGDTEE